MVELKLSQEGHQLNLLPLLLIDISLTVNCETFMKIFILDQHEPIMSRHYFLTLFLFILS